MIDHGHTPEAIERYTLAQVRFYGAAIDRARKREQRELALLVRAAFHYEPEQFQAFIKE